MKKKLSLVMVALVAIAAFATTMSLTMAKRAATNVFTLTLNGSEVSSPEGFFTHDTSDGAKFNFNNKFKDAEYADIAFTSGLKMEGSTKVFFTTTEASTVTIVQSTWSDNTIKLDGTELVVADAVAGTGCRIYTVTEVAAGDHSITRGSGESGLFYVKVEYAAAPEPAVVDKSYTLTFKDSGSGSDATADLSSEGSIEVSKILGEEEAAYVSSVSDATKVYLARTGRGLKLGTSSVAGKFTLNLATAVKPTSIVVKARKYSDSQYTIKINGNDFTLSADAGDDCTINYDGNTEVSSIAIEAGNNRAYVISVTVNYKEGGGDTPEPAGPQDIEISPASGDIAAALTEATEGKEVKDITINLTKDVTYTIGASLVAPNSITINGNGATIDASALEAALITTPTGDLAEWMTGNFTVKDVAIKGLKKSLYASAGKNYLYKDFLIDNCVIEITATGGFEFDFRKGGVAENFTVNNSTIYAPTATANSLYTSQSAQRATEAPDVTMQTFAFTNSTLYNLAKSKNFFTHRQNGQKWLTFIAKNSIFVNCGKSGQAIKGMNGGGSSANPTWDIVGNIFNYDGVDTSASEATGDAEEPVKDNVAGVVTFTDAATGNFAGAFVATEGAFVPAEMPGDPRWTITATPTKIEAVISGQEQFIGKQNITLSCALEGAKLYYTTDGNDPTTASTAYEAPFEISETTTVKAIAVYTFAGKDNVSAVASATFTLQTTFATIAELLQLSDGAGFGYTGEAQVVAQARSGSDIYSYIKDESGSALIFDAGGEKTPAEAVGKTLAKDWVGSVSIVNNLFELVPTAALTLTEGEAQEVKYPVVDFSYVTAEHANEVVMLSGVTFSFTNNEDLVIAKGESQLPALNKFALNPGFAKKDVEYNIVGAVSVNGDKVEFWPIDFVEKPTMDIVIEPAAGTDIAEALAKASEGIFVKDITINLEAEKLYTLSAPIYAPASITINGNGSSIDAIGVQGAFINFGAVPANVAEPAAAGAPLYAPASPVDGYTYVDNVVISNVTINGLKGSLYYDNKEKLCIENFAINNSLVNLEPENVNYESVIALEGGCAKNFSVVNSTFVGTGEGVKYFQRFNNGADFVKAGYEEAAVVYMNNTFVKVLKSDGQWGNNLRYNNNSSKIMLAISNNIWYECGNGQILRRMLNKNFDQFQAESFMANNTFWSENAPVDQGNYGNGSDLTGNPYFLKFWKDQVEDDDMWFAVDVQSQQATAGAGDLRWGTWAPTHYNIAVSEEALQCADITVQATALDGEVVKVKVEEKKGFKLKELIVKVGAQTTLVVTDNSFVMPPANVSVDAVFDAVAADYEIEVPTGTDIAAALDGLVVRNLKLTLAENGAYTLSKSIDFSGDLEILGKGATIDASGLAAPFINLNATPAVDPIVETTTDETTGETTETIKSYPIGAITVKDVTIKGLSQQLVKSNNLYLVNALTVENSVVEIKGAVKKSIFDFSGPNGNVIALVVNNSTLYADATTEWANGGFFSNQSGKKHSELGINTEAEGFEVLTAIQNSTLFNIANGRTTSTLRENSKPFMKYAVKNSIIVNSGKNGQFLKGLNSGQAGNDANWDVDGNLFNFDGAVAQEAVNNPENIKNTVDATVTFADTEAGIFNLTYVKNPRIAEWPAVGDPRWTAAAGATAYTITVDEAIVNGAVTPSATWSLADETIKLTVTPAEGYELETLTAKIGQTEIEIAEDNSFLMPAADVTVTATFVAVPKLYIIGGPKEWKLDDMTELTYNLETQTYEFEYKPETTAYFAIADKQFTAEEAAAENAWDVFNANNRYALAEGDTQIDLEVTKPLVKANGTLVLYAGTYKISITKDMQMTVIGERAPEPTEDTYIIAGSSAELLGTTWDGTNEANKLELNASTGLYEKTYEGVTLTAGTIEFKIVKNGSTWIPDGMGNNHTCEIPADGVYTVKVTFNTANPDKADDYEMVATPATGINAVTVDKLQNAVIYTLQGVRVEKARKGGVYIVNGKKVAIK